MFTPSRLTLARQKRGLTKKELAEKLDLNAQTITNFESEITKEEPSEKTLERIACVLGFPVSFFCKEKVDFEPAESASFRALSKMTSAQRNSSIASGILAFEVNNWFEKKFELPTHNLPDLRNETPESAATYIRQMWLLGEKPINNIIHLLESKGIRVFFIAEDNRNVDAFSIWNNGQPFILLNTFKSSERSRFDAAHELGHLLLHKHGVPRDRKAEQDANSFASAFLMPQSSIIAQVPSLPTIQNLIKLKHNWLVSLSAIVYRLKVLNLISEWQHRNLVIEINSKGYNINEPYSIQKESSQIFAKLFAFLNEEGITSSMIANEIGISNRDFQKLTTGISEIIGGNIGSKKQSNANLKRIK